MPPPVSSPAKIPNPTRFQILFSSLLLILLSIIILPISIHIIIAALLESHFSGNSISRLPRLSPTKTVLITGARTNKALVLVRAFRRAGYRVLIAEERTWGIICLTRFSRAADKYFSLPGPARDREGYKQAIVNIIARENVDIWVPCSSIFATVEDAEAAQIITESPNLKCEAFIQHPDLIDHLHWKDKFMQLCEDLDFPTPDSHMIASAEEGVEWLFSEETQKKGYKYIIKCVALDDAGRSDLTLLPLSTREETEQYFARMPIQPSPTFPFILQQYLSGPEYCTHGVVRNGRLTAFCASRSSDMVLRYVDLECTYHYWIRDVGCDENNMLEDRDGVGAGCFRDIPGLEALRKEWAIGRRTEDWTMVFLMRWAEMLQEQGKTGREAELTGHFSFDFMWDQKERMIYAIECNPRAHTAVALLSGCSNLAAAYTGTLPRKTKTPVRSTDRTPRSWLAHELPLSFASLVPASIASVLFPLLHPRLRKDSPPPPSNPDKEWNIMDATFDALHPSRATLTPFPGDGPLAVLWRHMNWEEIDVSWDMGDPLPFFVLAHIQMPWVLLKAMFSRKGWSRVNVSTARVYEC